MDQDLSDDYMHPQDSPERLDESEGSYDTIRSKHEDADASGSEEDGSEEHGGQLSPQDDSWSTSDVISDVFDQRVRVLAATLESVESRYASLSSKLTASEEQSASHMNRLEAADRASGRLKAHNESLKDREQILRQEVSRLQAQMQTCRIDTAISGSKLQQLLEEERLRTDRMRSLRDNALMQSTSTASIRASIFAAVAEAFSCSEEERKKKLRQLQLRWHPDKNPVLADLATEVSKMINEAIARMGSAS
ncbi:MAG: hypothetical protein WDW38_008256 [Sanguina aurantia]